MIAYLFWHTPRAGVDEAQYAAKLIHFHEELEQLGSGSTGLALDPVAYSLPEVPWIPVNRSVYLDVYAMDSTSRMETLNSAAVSGPMLQPHQEIAALYGSGAGSLYDVRAGQLGPATDSYWFAKPQGMTYAELDALLNPLITPGVALLRRLMVLGPSPEFCLLSPAPLTLPLTAEHRPLTTL
ncbi:MAG: hypothetical protein K2X03_16460 [Bryobacteraceae bacterium]|nr:hypothetical protein [Bryobacteraceae bacterium]